ncbi:Putative Spherulation-specific family 4 [Septoria linicola]|uniref:Spherulation-specific family 4 n=1 Tax=Septoria linicola TaxID=215465 RepID=A0A9Q9EFG4_9PEZI|nr:putative Spherulation-specific family 4 [Septoria linicola]USW48930.1 Putative Spherulation-specific family 4 [Septoria linicola]
MGLFSKLKRSSGSKVAKSTCIIPLYIYPTNSATWQPLLDAIDENPTLDFVVIVNPNSGPGTFPWWPNLDYLREVPKLNARSNCTVVGYVRVDYCNRDVAEVLADLRRYAKWPDDTGVKGLHISGIFFDETPNETSQFKATYLQKINQEVKNADGILGESLIIHNPGTLPDPQLTSKRPEITVVFEESYARLLQPDPTEHKSLINYDRLNGCYMVHTVPIDIVRDVTREARKRAQYVFVTDSRERYYEQFGAGFKDYIDAMAAD